MIRTFISDREASLPKDSDKAHMHLVTRQVVDLQDQLNKAHLFHADNSHCQPGTHQLWGPQAFHLSHGHPWRDSKGCTDYTGPLISDSLGKDSLKGFIHLLGPTTLQANTLQLTPLWVSWFNHPAVAVSLPGPIMQYSPHNWLPCWRLYQPYHTGFRIGYPWGNFINVQNCYKETFSLNMLWLTHSHPWMPRWAMDNLSFSPGSYHAPLSNWSSGCRCEASSKGPSSRTSLDIISKWYTHYKPFISGLDKKLIWLVILAYDIKFYSKCIAPYCTQMSSTMSCSSQC